MVDYVLTFEEMGSVFEAFDIDIQNTNPYPVEFESVREAHAFAQTGGVMGAVKAYLKKEVNGIQLADLNKTNIAMLRAYAKTGKVPAKFIEVMACEGGCITGPATYSGDKGKRMLAQTLAKWKKTY